jgi:MFS family permease
MVPIFVILCLICGGLLFYNRSKEVIPTVSPEFKRFQLTYLLPYFLMTAADWLQGPYVYALYESYGYDISDIGVLFTAGFGSSMIFGTFVGSLSDKFGRKFCSMIYVLFYVSSCLTKHSPNFWVLMLGRLLGGIATSILYSAFESWMVSEHFSKGFSDDWLAYTFYLQISGNSVVAILSGVVAGYVYQISGAMTAPFDTAIVLLVIGGAIIWLLWSENYGNANSVWSQSFVKAYQLITTDFKVLSLGIAQSFFESAMYIFVFMWTPTLDEYYQNLNHGLIFACFMVACMIGGSIFKLASVYYAKEQIMLFMFMVSATGLVIPVLFQDGFLNLLSFLIFEITVGIFWPVISTLKGIYIAEDVRSTVMNYFRIPTNFFVIVVLNQVKKLSKPLVFLICVILVVVSVGAAYYVHKSSIINQKKKQPEQQYVPIEEEQSIDDTPSQETYNS